MKIHTFKLTAILLILTGSFLAFSCKNTDASGSVTTKLQGSKWKLEGIVNVKTGKKEVIEPKDCTECYTLTFDTDSTFSTFSSVNELEGGYIINYTTKKFQIIYFGGTKIGEVGDGELFVEPFWTETIQTFSLQENELRLYYDSKKKYLLFRLQES